MARFTLVILSLAVLFAAAATTETMAEIENPATGCRQQIERQRLSSCRRYLRDSSRFTVVAAGNEGGEWREEFPRCCEALEQIRDHRCRCEAIRQVIQEERQAGELQGREMREMLRTAESLPTLCRISPQEYCENIREGPMSLIRF